MLDIIRGMSSHRHKGHMPLIKFDISSMFLPLIKNAPMGLIIHGVDNKTSDSLVIMRYSGLPPSCMFCPRVRNIFKGAENFTPDKKYFVPLKMKFNRYKKSMVKKFLLPLLFYYINLFKSKIWYDKFN